MNNVLSTLIESLQEFIDEETTEYGLCKHLVVVDRENSFQSIILKILPENRSLSDLVNEICCVTYLESFSDDIVAVIDTVMEGWDLLDGYSTYIEYEEDGINIQLDIEWLPDLSSLSLETLPNLAALTI